MERLLIFRRDMGGKDKITTKYLQMQLLQFATGNFFAYTLCQRYFYPKIKKIEGSFYRYGRVSDAPTCHCLETKRVFGKRQR